MVKDISKEKRRYYNTMDIATILGVSRFTAIEIAKTLPHLQFSKRFLVSISAFEQWLDDNTVQGSHGNVSDLSESEELELEETDNEDEE